MSASVYWLCSWKNLCRRPDCLPFSHGLSALAGVGLFDCVGTELFNFPERREIVKPLFSRRSQGVQEKFRLPRCAQYDRKHLWHRQWTLWGRIERRPMARTLNMLKTNAVAPRCNAALKERSGIAVWSP